MEAFKDAANPPRLWTLSVNAGSIKRTRAEAGVDLLEIGAKGPADKPQDLVEFRLYADPVLLCDVLYALVRPEAEKKGIDRDSFDQAMTGDALDAGRKALLEDVVNFTPNPQRREAMRKALTLIQTMMDRGMDLAKARLNDPSLQKTLESELAKLDARFTALLGSSTSTPSP